MTILSVIIVASSLVHLIKIIVGQNMEEAGAWLFVFRSHDLSGDRLQYQMVNDLLF